MAIDNSRLIETFKFILAKGIDGAGIEDVRKTSSVGLVDTYTIYFTDGSRTTFDITNGNGIVSVTKTATVDLIDTYTILFDDGSSTTFDVTNGSNGSNENLADIAPSLVAQKDYAVNEHLIYDDVYYIVTQPILTGENIVIGTNVERRKVGDEISFIANIRVDNGILYLPRTGVSVSGSTLYINMFN